MRSFFCCLFLLTIAAGQAAAAQLKPEAIKAWDHYIAVTEARIAEQQRDLPNFIFSHAETAEQKAVFQSQPCSSARHARLSSVTRCTAIRPIHGSALPYCFPAYRSSIFGEAAPPDENARTLRVHALGEVIVRGEVQPRKQRDRVVSAGEARNLN